ENHPLQRIASRKPLYILFASKTIVLRRKMPSSAIATIPRLHQILPHMREQLIGLVEGATFEAVRQRYSATVEKLELQGVGRRTASRVGDKDAYWSPTAALLTEAMRLGFVERQQVPSARRYIEAHQDRKYALTKLGREVADLAQNDIAAFCDR